MSAAKPCGDRHGSGVGTGHLNDQRTLDLVLWLCSLIIANAELTAISEGAGGYRRDPGVAGLTGKTSPVLFDQCRYEAKQLSLFGSVARPDEKCT